MDFLVLDNNQPTNQSTLPPVDLADNTYVYDTDKCWMAPVGMNKVQIRSNQHTIAI